MVMHIQAVDISEVEKQYPIPVAPIHHVILDCSTMGFLDTMGAAGIGTVSNQLTIRK